MIYADLLIEFFKIGLFAIGGGLVTVPFLFELSEKYHWYTSQELMDMIAVSQSTPGPIGVNMATYVGYTTTGIGGGILATLSLVLPSIIVVYIIAKALDKWHENIYVKRILSSIRPAVLSLILFAGLDIAKESITDYKEIIFLIAMILAMRIYKKNVIIYIIMSGIIGLIFQI